MLPRELHGPNKVVFWRPDAAQDFVERARVPYPHLDPDFISQICYEHPDRFDQLLPGFNVDECRAVRRARSAGWVYDFVRWDDGDLPDMWATQFDQYLEAGNVSYPVFSHMSARGSFPFPPVVVDCDVARRLGITVVPGAPFHLVEGCHRVSYLRRMLERALVSRDSEVEVIEIVDGGDV